jgi:hypothetical protein
MQKYGRSSSAWMKSAAQLAGQEALVLDWFVTGQQWLHCHVAGSIGAVLAPRLL